MRKAKLEHYRKLLQAKHAEITRNFSKSRAESRSAGDDGTEDYIDYAVNSYGKEFLLSLTDLERQQIVLIQEALVRIRSGDYGDCQQCGEEISEKRLEAAPWELEEQGLLPQYPGGIRDEEFDEDAPEAPADEEREEFAPDEEE